MPETHVIVIHGISGIREQGWSETLRKACKVPHERWHPIYWADLTSVAGIEMTGDNKRDRFWDLADDLLLYETGCISAAVLRRVAACLATDRDPLLIPLDAKIVMVGHSAGGCIAVDAMMGSDRPIERLITVCAPLRTHVYLQTQGAPELFSWPHPKVWWNLHCRWDPISAKRGPAHDLCPWVHDQAICNFPRPHTDWQKNKILHRLVCEVTERS